MSHPPPRRADRRARDRRARPPPGAAGRAADRSPSSVKSATSPCTFDAIPATCRSSALRMTRPLGFVTRRDDRLHLGQLGQRVDALEVHVVRGHVRDDARVVRLVSDAAQDIPPRAVSRTATSRSSRARIDAAPAGPVQSPCSTISPSTTIPSDVVAPTRFPDSRRMWTIRRVVVVLPLVPVIETIGSRRSASRSHVGPSPSAASTRSERPATSRPCRGVRMALDPAGTSRSTSARAASAIAFARSPSSHGQARIQCPGSDDRWTLTGPAAPSGCSRRSRRTQSASAATRAGCSSRGTAAVSRTRACRSGSRRPYQVRRRPIATSSFAAGASRYRFGPSSRRISMRRTARRE